MRVPSVQKPRRVQYSIHVDSNFARPKPWIETPRHEGSLCGTDFGMLLGHHTRLILDGLAGTTALNEPPPAGEAKDL